nr:Gfo/Idh/MocA family oxidoreductase [bacterium]
MTQVTVALSGLGGYGENYTRWLLDGLAGPDVRFVAGVDPFPERCRCLERVRQAGIPLYRTLGDMFASGIRPDLCIISSPIAFHVPQAVEALEGGCHVLLEKPLCPVAEDAARLIRARNIAGKKVMIGYQWAHSRAIGAFKKDIIAGRFGAPKRLRTLVLWPRTATYYHRGTGWAGKIRDGKDGWLLDSVLHNATAHYLFNMFYCLGQTTDSAVTPLAVEAAVGRANPIENFDTAAVRCRLAGGVEALYVASHAVNMNIDPSFRYEFEKGTAIYGPGEGMTGNLRALLDDGTVIDYGPPEDEYHRKLVMAVEAVRGGEVVCGIESALAEVLVANAVQEACPVTPFDAGDILVDGELTHVRGLEDELIDAYQSWRMPWEGEGKYLRHSGSFALEEGWHFPRAPWLK